MRRRQWPVFLAAALLPSAAYGYCRTRTCKAACPRDEQGCAVGVATYWPTPSLAMSVDPAGSALRAITGEDARATLERALRAWTSVDCGGFTPSLGVTGVDLLTPVQVARLALDVPATDADAGEASSTDRDFINTLRFFDVGWIGGFSAIALTTSTFIVETGRILEADIEVNSEAFNLTTADVGGDYDLASILAHETGHVLGLDEVWVQGPTMCGYYNGAGDLGPRSLEADDIAGICAMYPAGRFDREEGCGCSVPGARPRLAPWVLLGVSALWVLARRRRGPAVPR